MMQIGKPTCRGLYQYTTDLSHKKSLYQYTTDLLHKKSLAHGKTHAPVKREWFCS